MEEKETVTKETAETKEELIKEESKPDDTKEETPKEESKPDDTKEETPKEELKPEKAKEEVTFAKQEVSFIKSGTKQIMEEETNDSDEGVVFAAMPDHDKKNAEKRKFPVIPVIAATAAVCILACLALVYVNAGKETVPTVAESSGMTAEQQSQEESVNLSSKEENDKKDMPTVIEQSIQISEIDTSSIVFGDHVTVEGVSLAGKTLAQAFDAMQEKVKSLREPISIKINCDGKELSLTQDDFEYDTDIANVLIQAYHYSRNELDAPSVEMTQNGDTADFKLTSVLNRTAVGGAVKKAADTFDILPVDAHVTKFNPSAKEKFTYADGTNGFMIDQKELTDKIGKVLTLSQKTGTITIAKKETPFEVTLPLIKANTKLIASAYTTAANVWASNYNMELAIKSASGTIVKPGETFSFNKMTGDTTTGALGYIPSTAIVRGEYVAQYGGGICQASTTLYLCALKADMEVVERWAHAYPSVYADRGLDATVDYGNLDMKFKNTKDFPIYIATYVYDYDGDGLDELLVEMYGPLSTEYDEIVPVGWVTSAGYDGYYAKGAKVYFKNGKEIKREYTPGGSYDYKYDTYQSALNRIPADPNFGPKDVSPTLKPPAVFSPNGAGSNAPVAYGKAEEYLKKAATASAEPVKQESSVVEQSSQQQASQQQPSQQQSSQQQSSQSQQQSSQQQSSQQQSSQQQSSQQQSSQQQSSQQQSSQQQSSQQQSSQQQSSQQQSSQQQSSSESQQSSEVQSSASEPSPEESSVVESSDDEQTSAVSE